MLIRRFFTKHVYYAFRKETRRYCPHALDIATTRPNSTAPGKFVARYANSLEDFIPVFDYMVKEGWTPAVGDVEAYYSVDPSGCFVGELDGKKIAFLSCLKYSKSKLCSDGPTSTRTKLPFEAQNVLIQ